MVEFFFPVCYSLMCITMNSNDVFLTLQFLEVHLNGRKYSPRQSTCYWTHLACINVPFNFRVTGKKWTELAQIVRVPVPNLLYLGDYCLIYPAVTDLRAINANLDEKVESLTAVSISSTSLSKQSLQLDSASLCLMVKWDFMIFHMKMFPKHCLQKETWLYRYLIEDNPRPCFVNLTEYIS